MENKQTQETTVRKLTATALSDKLIENLAPVEPRLDVNKRAPEEPDVTWLKSEQMAAFDKMRNWSFEKKGGMFLLSGYAGTGKTFLTTFFGEWFLALFRGEKVSLTAPTNKAVRVLKDNCDFVSEDLSFSTIHSLLGLKQKINDDGQAEFVPNPDETPRAAAQKLIVVDEASMLNDSLFNYLVELMGTHNLKILFVGDPLQIPPIGKDHCLPFDEPTQQRLNFWTASLRSVLRQAKDNPIIALSMDIRKQVSERNVKLPTEAQMPTMSSGILPLDRYTDKAELQKIVTALFTSEQYEKFTGYVKIIAWRNAIVDTMNSRIRQIKFGDGLQKIVKGERLIANAPIVRKSEAMKEIIFNTNDEFRVLDYSIEEESINEDEYVLKYYAASVLDENDLKKTIHILHESSEALYNNLLRTLASVANSYPPRSFDRIDAWKDFWQFKERFADVKYSYALTCHKAQGSTYDYTIVMGNDITMNPRTYEAHRILYTACTRPSKVLVLVN